MSLARRQLALVTGLLLLAVLALPRHSAAAQGLPPRPTVPPPPRSFGVTAWNRPLSPLVLERVSAAGTAWQRYGELSWNELEPTEGHINWAALAWRERDLAALSARGIKVHVIIFGAPVWARAQADSYCGPVKPEKYAAFARFAAQMVAHFKAAPYNVRDWEIWNEPDAPVVATTNQPYGCWGKPNTTYYGGDDYGRMLKVVYPAVKAADPGATVIMGGLLMGCGVSGVPCDAAEQPGLKFLRGVLAVGAGNSFDVLAYHAYAGWLPSLAGKDDRDRQTYGWESKGGITFGKLSDLRATLGGLRKPIVMNEGALLWCSEEQATSWCRTQGVTTPGADYRRDQATYLVRLYTRGWAYGLAGVNWYLLDNGGWRGSGLLDKGTETPRPAYMALQTLSAMLRGTTYAGGTVTLGRPEVAAFEDYRFCKGSSEVRVLWANQPARTVSVQLPPGTTGAIDLLGTRLALTNPLRVGFKPTILSRQLGAPCAASHPSAVSDYVVRPYGGRQWQAFFANGRPGQPGTIWSRVSTDAAGARWPATWTRTSYAAAWGVAPGGPPRDRIDAYSAWAPPGAGRWRQEVYAGATVWSRDSADAAGTAWVGPWTSRPLAAAWGGAPNRPSTTGVDAVAVHPMGVGVWRQTVLSGGTMWYRDGLAGPGGFAWANAWHGPASLNGTWGANVNHPPVDRVDGYAIHPALDPAGHPVLRQTFVADEAAWTRLSTDAAGTRWPASWDSLTLASAVGANTAVGTRPPVYAAP